MKLTKLIAIIALFFAANTMSAQATIDKWAAMKTFHEVMARVYHPVEEGNLEPLKSFAETLDNKAKELSTKEIPAEFKTKQLMASVKKLQEQTAMVNKLVKTHAADADLKKAITEAHDTFHGIVGMCTVKSTNKKIFK